MEDDRPVEATNFGDRASDSTSQRRVGAWVLAVTDSSAVQDGTKPGAWIVAGKVIVDSGHENEEEKLVEEKESATSASTDGDGTQDDEIKRAIEQHRSQYLQLSFGLELNQSFKQIATSTWCTATHIFIHGPHSPPSSDYQNSIRPETFSGNMALDLMLALEAHTGIACLDPLARYAPGDRRCLSMRAVRGKQFGCATQFLSAVKALEFEDLDAFCCKGQPQIAISKLILGLMRGRRHSGINKHLYASALFRILRNKDPDRQKQVSKQIEVTDEKAWTSLAEIAMTAAIITRSRVSPILREFIMESGNRTFVKVGRADGFWGSKCAFSKVNMFRPEAWRGRNQLGRCYERARDYLRKEQSDSESEHEAPADPRLAHDAVVLLSH